MFAAYKSLKKQIEGAAFQRDFLIFRGVFNVLKKISPITFLIIIPLGLIYGLLLPYLLFVVPPLFVGDFVENESVMAILIVALVVPLVWLVYFLAVFLSSLYSVVVVSQVNQVLHDKKPSLFSGILVAIREIINIFLFSALAAGAVGVLIGAGQIFTPKNSAGGVVRNALFTAVGAAFNVGMSFVVGFYPSIITVEKLNFIPSLNRLADELKSNFGKKILASAELTVLKEVVSTIILWSLTPLAAMVLIFISFSWWGLTLFYMLFLLGLFIAYVVFVDSVVAVFFAIVYKYQRTNSLPFWLSADVKNAICEFSIPNQGTPNQ